MPGHLRMRAPMARRMLVTLGVVFIAVGLIGFILSMLPAFV